MNRHLFLALVAILLLLNTPVEASMHGASTLITPDSSTGEIGSSTSPTPNIGAFQEQPVMDQNKLRSLKPTEFVEQITRVRSSRGTFGEVKILTSTEDHPSAGFSPKATFNPKTGILNNGHASVNLYELYENDEVIPLSDGRIIINDNTIKGTINPQRPATLQPTTSEGGPSTTPTTPAKPPSETPSFDQQYVIDGSINGITPEPGMTFRMVDDLALGTIGVEHQDDGTLKKVLDVNSEFDQNVIIFTKPGKLQSIDPDQETFFAFDPPTKPDYAKIAKEQGDIDSSSLILPGGQRLRGGLLTAHHGTLYAMDYDAMDGKEPLNAKPIINGFEIDATDERLPILFTEPNQAQERYAYIGADRVEVHGQGAKMTARIGNTLFPANDLGVDPETGKKVPIDFASIMSEDDGTARIYPLRYQSAEILEPGKPRRPVARAEVIGNAGIENAFWAFTSDGTKVIEKPLSDLHTQQSYDGIGMTMDFYSDEEDRKTEEQFSRITLEDNPKSLVDSYITPRFNSYRNTPATDSESVRERTLPILRDLVGLRADVDDGIEGPRQTGHDVEQCPGSQAVCNFVGMRPAELAGSPFADLMLARGQFATEFADEQTIESWKKNPRAYKLWWDSQIRDSNIPDWAANPRDMTDLRRNWKLVPLLKDMGTYTEFGKDYFNNLKLHEKTQVPEQFRAAVILESDLNKYAQEKIPLTTTPKQPRPGDILMFNVYDINVEGVQKLTETFGANFRNSPSYLEELKNPKKDLKTGKPIPLPPVWTFKPAYHMAVIDTIENGKIGKIYEVAPYDPNNPYNAVGGLYHADFDGYLTQRIEGTPTKPNPRIYIPAGFGSFPGKAEAQAYINRLAQNPKNKELALHLARKLKLPLPKTPTESE